MMKHPLSNLAILMELNKHLDWTTAEVELKVYSRPDLCSDEDPENRPGYYERKTVKVKVQDILSLEDVDTLKRFIGAHHGEDISIGNRIDFRELKVGSTNFQEVTKPLFYAQMDMSTAELSPGDLFSIEAQAKHNLSLYRSGRSFHLYGQVLMTESEWHRYMGRMLLLNVPASRRLRSGNFSDVFDEDMKDEEKYEPVPAVILVDSRWIGHSLEAGQSYMRLTASSGGYLQMPEYLDEVVNLRKKDSFVKAK